MLLLLLAGEVGRCWFVQEDERCVVGGMDAGDGLMMAGDAEMMLIVVAVVG